MKILNNALVKNCGECPEWAKYGMSDCGITKKIIFADDANKIDPSCPLQQVEVYPDDANLQWLLNMDTLSAEFLNSIDYIVVVKKARREVEKP